MFGASNLLRAGSPTGGHSVTHPGNPGVTRDRQEAARALAGMVDAFYIIGGRHSSNSVKLLAVCKVQCEKSFLIETEDEINAGDLTGAEKVGVTAGASTPDWLIKKIVKHLEDIGREQSVGLKP